MNSHNDVLDDSLQSERVRPEVTADSLPERLLEFWRLPLFSRPWFTFAFLALLAAACALRAWIGVNGIREWVHDAFVSLDGAWRVRNGQIPYIDFSTDVGPLVHILNAVGLMLARNMPAGLAYAQALAAFIVGIWSFAISRRRMSALASLLVTAVLVFLAVSPFDTGNPPTRTSTATVYNRLGYAFVGIVVIEAVCARILTTKFSEFRGGLSSGCILIILLLIKISYFPGTVLLLLVLTVCRRQTKSRWIGLGIGAAAGLVIFAIYMHWNLAPMFRDLRILAGAKRITKPWFLIQAMYDSAMPLLVLAFLAFLLLRRCNDWADARRIVTIALALAGVGLCFAAANFPGSRLPLNAVAAIIILDRVEAWFSNRRDAEVLVRSAILLTAGLLIGTALFLDGGGLGYGAAGRFLIRKVPHSSFQEPTLAGFTTFEPKYVRFADDGFALARQYKQPGDMVAALDFCNPFAYVFRTPPMEGGAAMGLVFGTNYTDRDHLPPDWLLGSASLVLVPNRDATAEPELVDHLLEVYNPWLLAHYRLIGSNLSWRIYRRNTTT